ncbi:hypothetical protein K432DRAFT_119027 [Lepidopterella palustris CBS 459.81]|uniref:Uncharacterized protein n=1 Tax=Lepidopterella palustris CBS 459.81 TaxID=1314670 RepID=A0A8E2EI97_9PEZI|nr:hypothetical protein K432DRAFT_119027 [Lepidopterella palustris CBS 459.81]
MVARYCLHISRPVHVNEHCIILLQSYTSGSACRFHNITGQPGLRLSSSCGRMPLRGEMERPAARNSVKIITSIKNCMKAIANVFGYTAK